MKRILSLSIGLALTLTLSHSPLQAGHGHSHGGHCHGGHYHGGSSWFVGISPGWSWGWSYPSYSYYRPYYSYYRPRYSPLYGYAYDYRRPAVFTRPSLSADVQIALRERGYYYGNIDGIIGPQSRNAIKRYQWRNGLPMTGVIDDPLMRSLALR
ncbi:peptidoglycan-binding protein [Roseimicrobium sp. ORNL1]|uniref:peptidoglycan-binding protein n=1 Tax=Roseimicrobium sp. ORNL1 TaxID=2711231 RepID=UPI0013E1E2A6|nr:peptidoglycan-binding protein [Roseimicrobium sp. ORNL1]QIF01881.1 hypothetical protein G5S37_10190 [Roseimicrobium sp. ORNL1]